MTAVHPLGRRRREAPPVPPPGVREIDAIDGYGALHPGSSPLVGSAQWPWQIARGLALRADGASGYSLDGFGGVHPLGAAPGVGTTGYWPNWDVTRGIALRPDGASGYVLDAFGGLHLFGGAPFVAVSGYWPG